MGDLHLLLVNPPETVSRPDHGNTGTLYIPDGLIVRCINPGILAIASYVHSKGFEVEIVDLLETPDLTPLREVISRQQPWVIGISCSNGFSYLSTLACANLARDLCPDSLIAVGGQHVGPLGKTVLLESDAIDVLVRYEGELPTERLVNHFKQWGRKRPPLHIPGIVYREANGNIGETDGIPELCDLNDLPYLRFELYPNYKKFNPYVEESRGCSFKCNYCLANYTNLSRIRVKRYDRFLDELKHIMTLYGREPLYPILASTFGTRVQNTLRILEGMHDLGIHWTTEFRVDGAWPKLLDTMYNSGFRIATVGLESASSEILLRMNKTERPGRYLACAQELIDALARYEDLLLKFNIIIYIGETPKTIRETLSFLLKNDGKIASVRFSPLFGFPGSPFLSRFEQYARDFGASLITEGYWGSIHIYPVNVSRYFSFEECAEFCNLLEKVFTDERVYFEANQYTYGLENLDEIRKRVIEARIFSHNKLSHKGVHLSHQEHHGRE